MRHTFTSKKVIVIEIPEWKSKTILARNTMFVKENMTRFLPILGKK